MSAQPEFIVEAILKRDAFSEIQSGHFAAETSTRLTRRRLDRLPLWSRGIGRYLAAREARALKALEGVHGVPRLISFDRTGLIRSWIDGSPLHQVGSINRRWSDDAHRLLRQMHQRGVTHNDLAKPQNWLATPDGHVALIDMQLATVHRSRGRLFRLAKYEDLRHLLKQKQRFAPELLTPTARRLLKRRSWPSRVWRATAKPVYNFVTRRLLNWSDNEGSGKELPSRIEAVQAALLAAPGVRDAVIVPFPQPGGTGIYAFVETDSSKTPNAEAAPDLLQVVKQLPRSAEGHIRTEVLALIAENRIEELEALLVHDPELAAILKPIAEARLNLTDRYIR